MHVVCQMDAYFLMTKTVFCHCCAQYKYIQECLNMDKSLMTGFVQEDFSMKEGGCVFFEIGEDQFCLSQAT